MVLNQDSLFLIQILENTMRSRSTTPQNCSGDVLIQQLILSGDIESLRRALSEKRVDIDKISALNSYESTPLMTACRYGNTEAVSLLLELKANVDIHEPAMRQTALMHACKGGFTQIVRMLLDHGATFNLCDNDNKTPLIMACRGGHQETALLLLERGADPTTMDLRNQTALCYAVERVKLDLVLALAQKEIEVYEEEKERLMTTALKKPPRLGSSISSTKPAEKRHLLFLKCLVKEAPEIEAVLNDVEEPVSPIGETVRGFNPVMAACIAGRVDTLNTLLKHGASICEEKVDNEGRNAIMMAAEFGHEACVSRILETTCLTKPEMSQKKFNRVDEKGLSPLMLAAKEGHYDLVDLLLDSGMPCDSLDRDGKSALLLAALGGHSNVVWLLRTKGDCSCLGDVHHWSSLFLRFETIHQLAAAEIVMFDMTAEKPIIPETYFIRCLPHLKQWLSFYITESPNLVHCGLKVAGALKFTRKARVIAFGELTYLYKYFLGKVERCISADCLTDIESLHTVLGYRREGGMVGHQLNPILNGPIATASKYGLKSFLILPQVADFISQFWFGDLINAKSESFFLIQSPTRTPSLTFCLWRKNPLVRTLFEAACLVLLTLLTSLNVFDLQNEEALSHVEIGLIVVGLGFVSAEINYMLCADYPADMWDTLRALPALPFLLWLPLRLCFHETYPQLRDVSDLVLSANAFFLWGYFIQLIYLFDISGKYGILLVLLRSYQYIFRFTIIFAILLLTFAVMLSTQYEYMVEFDSITHCMLSLYMMSTGNYDLSIFDHSENFAYGYVLCLIFLFLNGLLLPGLLVAILTTAFSKFDQEARQESAFLRLRFLSERSINEQSKLREKLLLPPPLSVINLLISPLTAGKSAINQGARQLPEVIILIIDILVTCFIICPCCAVVDLFWAFSRPRYWIEQAKDLSSCEIFPCLILLLGIFRPVTYYFCFVTCCINNEITRSSLYIDISPKHEKKHRSKQGMLQESGKMASFSSQHDFFTGQRMINSMKVHFKEDEATQVLNKKLDSALDFKDGAQQVMSELAGAINNISVEMKELKTLVSRQLQASGSKEKTTEAENNNQNF